MARPDSPDSPLSSMESADEQDYRDRRSREIEMDNDHDHEPEHDHDQEVMDDGPPAKRQKVGGSRASSAVTREPEPEPVPSSPYEPLPQSPTELDNMSAVSEDTEGDVPNSPLLTRADEDDLFQEQVSTCAWIDCTVGDLGNMDKLVQHINDAHIENGLKRYTCEWVGCGRKGLPHASGYALKAHMRSHTREKPFYCYLPECDRAFTRSDALAKHMRTVHETEALRPSDPVPKSMQTGTGKGGKLKIVLKTQQSHAAGLDDVVDDGSNGDDSGSENFTPLTAEQGFTPEQLAMSRKRLFELCSMEMKWAEQEREQLLRECKEWEALYKQEWLEKEVLLDQVVQSEQAWHARRQAVLAATMNMHMSMEEAGAEMRPADAYEDQRPTIED